MRFCEHSGCSQPVFGTCKQSRKGFCKSHQADRLDFNRKSITQRAIEKHKANPTKQIVKEPRFKRAGTFDESVIGNDWEVVETNPGAFELWDWFIRQRERMVGICAHCGGKSQKHDDKTFHYSIAHLFEKSKFLSIAQHDSNWIELCYYNESCHTNFDNKMLSLTDLNCFEEVVQKFVILYPLMTREEKRRVPNVLLTYLDAEL